MPARVPVARPEVTWVIAGPEREALWWVTHGWANGERGHVVMLASVEDAARISTLEGPMVVVDLGVATLEGRVLRMLLQRWFRSQAAGWETRWLRVVEPERIKQWSMQALGMRA